LRYKCFEFSIEAQFHNRIVKVIILLGLENFGHQRKCYIRVIVGGETVGAYQCKKRNGNLVGDKKIEISNGNEISELSLG